MTEQQAADIIAALSAIRVLLCLVLGALFADAMWRR